MRTYLLRTSPDETIARLRRDGWRLNSSKAKGPWIKGRLVGNFVEGLFCFQRIK